MKKQQLIDIIKEEIHNVLKTDKLPIVNEVYDLESVNYSSTVRTQVDKLVAAIEKSPNLNKTAVAAILNDIVMALGLDRRQISMYMNMIKQDRDKHKF